MFINLNNPVRNMTLQAANFRIKHKDYFSMRGLYVVMHEWLVEEGWATRSDPEFPETFYLHRDTLSAGAELWIWWRVEKFPNNVFNSYYKYKMNIDFHVILLEDAEIIFEGQKFKANRGEPEIKVKATCVSDWQKTWAKHWLLKNFQELFWKRIFKNEFEMHKHELYREAYRFQEAIKTYMKLRTYLPEPELNRFFRRKDYSL